MTEQSITEMRIPELREQLGNEKFLELVATLTEEEATEILYDWNLWARENQKEPPGDWSIWLVMAGRGFGKTRMGSEWIRKRVKEGKARYIALVSQSAADARDILVEGESGILAVHPPDEMPLYQPSKKRIVWPNGAVAHIFTAEDPDALRGPSHDTALVDEIATYMHVDDVWSNLMLTMRLPHTQPKTLVTTTPKPIKVLKELINRAQYDHSVYVTTGTTYDNIINLSETYRSQIIKQWEGTRLGRQELEGKLLDDVENALWTTQIIENNRRDQENVPVLDDFTETAVAVDPSVSGDDGTETGIMVGGIDKQRHGWLLKDATFQGSPRRWAQVAIREYYKYNCRYIVAEKNNGGELVKNTILAEDPSVKVKLVWASQGKLARAEPISSLDEQGMIHIVGSQTELEDELCSYDGSGKSPNRLDAYVWLFTHLMIKRRQGATWGGRYRSRSGRHMNNLRERRKRRGVLAHG